MMKLRFSPTSPYVRKVTVLALEAGLHDRIERVPTLPHDPKTDLPKDNPLGKVPALTLDDGTSLYDSPVICEYLDSLHGGAKMIPAAGAARWTALRREALCDGILDAGILRLLELRRPENERSPAWIERQKTVVSRGLDALESEAASLGRTVDIAAIAAGCTIGWVLFRFGADNPLGARPKLKAWYDAFATRPSMVATVPQDPK
jgi:glutathione S-transferase